MYKPDSGSGSQENALVYQKAVLRECNTFLASIERDNVTTVVEMITRKGVRSWT